MLPRSTKSKQLYLGQRMANFLYNFAQDEQIPQDWRDQAEQLFQSWDELKKVAHGEDAAKRAQRERK